MSDKFLEHSNLNESLTRVNENILMRSEHCANGLIFIPYLYGERAPVWEPDAKGLFYGITSSHTKTDFARAVIEGVIMNLRYNAELIKNPINRNIVLSGSVFNIEGIPQLTANILGMEVHFNSGTDLSARGAAIIALEAIGEEHSGKVMGNDTVFKPDDDFVTQYEAHFREFRKVVELFY